MFTRTQRARHCAAQSAPQPRRAPIRVQSAARASCKIFPERSGNDRDSDYEPTSTTKDPAIPTAAANSRMWPEAQMTPSMAFLSAES